MRLKIAGYVKIHVPYSCRVREFASQLVEYHISEEVLTHYKTPSIEGSIIEAILNCSANNIIDISKDVLSACKESAVDLHGRFCIEVSLETRITKSYLKGEYTIPFVQFKIYFMPSQIIKIEENDLYRLISSYLSSDKTKKLNSLVADAIEMNKSLNELQHKIKLRERQMGVKNL